MAARMGAAAGGLEGMENVLPSEKRRTNSELLFGMPKESLIPPPNPQNKAPTHKITTQHKHMGRLLVRKLRKNRKLWEGTAAGVGLSEWLPRDLGDGKSRAKAGRESIRDQTELTLSPENGLPLPL